MLHLNQITKILIAVENSKSAELVASYGYEIAHKLNASVALLHVNDVPVATPYLSDPLLNESQVIIPEVVQAQDEASKHLLEDLTERFSNGVTTYTFNKLGSPREEILATAEEWGADLIVAGTHGRTGFDHFLSGSVAEKVVRKTKCPVLIVPTKEEEND